MSSWAVTEKGEESRSAWEYRAIYLKYGTKYDEFFCPFCDIKLCAFLIYTDGELSKSPYFSARWDQHRNGCDGEPIFVERAGDKPPKAHYVKRDMYFPEAFADRPPPRIPQPAKPALSSPIPSPDEIRARRKNAGSLGKPVPKTYLLQPIVEANNEVVHEGFKQAKAKKWNEVKRKDWTTKALREMPLRLEDRTNYDNAFRTPRFLDSKYRRIYHGRGFVMATPEGFIISSQTEAKITDVHSVPFQVSINKTLGNETSPRAHIATINDLTNHAKNKTELRWYAYGKPQVTEKICELGVESLDYFYSKPAHPKENTKGEDNSGKLESR